MNQALTIDPNAPLPNGLQMLLAAQADLGRMVPVAPSIPKTGVVKRATGFRRAPLVARNSSLSGRAPVAPHRRIGGGTRYYRADVSQAFATRVANRNGPAVNNKRATALLFASGTRNAGPQTGPWGVQIHAPKAQYLDAVNRRAYAAMMVNTLTKRFNDNRLDWADNRADTERMVKAQRAYGLPASVLVYT